MKVAQAEIRVAEPFPVVSKSPISNRTLLQVNEITETLPSD